MRLFITKVDTTVSPQISYHHHIDAYITTFIYRYTQFTTSNQCDNNRHLHISQ